MKRHQAALAPGASLALGGFVGVAVACLAWGRAQGAERVAGILWAALVGFMAYRVFATGKIGRWRSAFFIILAWAFVVHFKAALIGLTGSAFISHEAQEVPTCHIALASSFLNTLYAQYLALMSGDWLRWSVLSWGALWLVVTLALGQAWCSWACVYGGLDTGFSKIARKPRLKWLRVPSGFRDLPAAVLAAMLLLSLLSLQPVFCLWACPLKLGTGFLDPNTLTRQIQTAIFVTVGLGTIVALPLLTKKRAFCGLVCPFGAWQAFFGRLNPFRVKIRPDSCTQCGLCVRACPTFAIDEDALKGHRVLAYCNRCGECMDVCPTGAIDYGIAGAGADKSPRLARIAFLLSAWLVAGSVSLLAVPDAAVRIWRAFAP